MPACARRVALASALLLFLGRDVAGQALGSDVAQFSFGAVVESLGAQPAQIVVERGMYWNAGVVGWAAGTNLLATRLR